MVVVLLIETYGFFAIVIAIVVLAAYNMVKTGKDKRKKEIERKSFSYL